MIGVFPRGVRGIVLVLGIVAGVAGCKLNTRDNPAVCDPDAGDGCADKKICNLVTHKCEEAGGRGGTTGATGGAVGSGGEAGQAAGGTGQAVGGTAGHVTASGGSGDGGGHGGRAAGGGAGGGGPECIDGVTKPCPSERAFCLDGSCVACKNDGDCKDTTPICSKNTCVSCVGAETNACASHAGTLVCAKSGAMVGACVKCDTNLDCTQQQAPFCSSTNVCVACAEAGGDSTCRALNPLLPLCAMSGSPAGMCVECRMNTDCTDTTKPVCSSSGACVACNASSDCPTAAPICDTIQHTCGGCTTDDGCKARDKNLPHCASQTTKTCVECTDSAHCTADTTKPICGAASRCLACTSDLQCQSKSGANPGVCMFHQDGRCATDGETIYVQRSTGCVMTVTAGTTAGTSAAPYCLPQTGIGSVTTARRLVVLRGPMPLANFTAGPLDPELSVVGQSGAIIAPGTFAGIHVTTGKVYVRGLTVQNGTDVGISADGGSTLRLDRVISRNNTLGGLILSGAQFEVVNSVFDGNGPGVVGATGFGGVYLGVVTGVPAGTTPSTRFMFNTILNNKDKGLACESGMQKGVGLLLYNNTTGDSINCMVGSSKASADGDPMFDTARPYHLTNGSGCKNYVGGADHPPDDLDGDARSSSMMASCGADEPVPVP